MSDDNGEKTHLVMSLTTEEKVSLHSNPCIFDKNL